MKSNLHFSFYKIEKCGLAALMRFKKHCYYRLGKVKIKDKELFDKAYGYIEEHY
jgi:hypothetical protein